MVFPVNETPRVNFFPFLKPWYFTLFHRNSHFLLGLVFWSGCGTDRPLRQLFKINVKIDASKVNSTKLKGEPSISVTQQI